ncbi:hypothetical protein CU669_03980 [Paramagnetospirillum kuznetsovii]|uniref:Alkaline proteinase inhibitor/ Outer membrane lipoprotein Omp19 domain-containing protein n=2 Tax=Paramagnetospirillum kuznetsovii TaxID=2053833 RepID=A0A364P2D3_9PROT|nr:hypothetical protein CU669_03980 [Paramagnetospirillum kuznetsovii]
MVLSVPALAEDLPQGPKAPPPEPLPEAICDTSKADAGNWLLGRWVAPYSKWEFIRPASGPMTWTLEQKADLNQSLGWKQGTRIDGRVATLSPCSARLEAGDDGQVAFTFDGVLTAEGKVYGYAMNTSGQQVRWILRRER